MDETVKPRVYRALTGALCGAIAGLLFGLLVPSSHGLGARVAVGVALGAVFGLFFGPHVRTAGTGLVWGQAYGLLCWLLGPVTLLPLLSGQGLRWTASAAQETLPLLLGQVIGYGAALGLGYYGLIRGLDKIRADNGDVYAEGDCTRPVKQRIVPHPARAVIVGGLGGLVGSWVFARGIEAAEFFPLVAGLMGSNAMALGRLLHYTIGLTIGVSFGLLFSRDIHGAGSSLVWGLDYGLVWWTVGPMTLLPLLLGMQTQPDWSLHTAQQNVPSLVAHLLYGSIAGLFYALANKAWRVLFIDSDPVNRALESPGSRGLRIVLMGVGSGVIGGLLFTFVMVGTGALYQVAHLVGARSAFTGFLVHLLIAIVVGISYGLLFGRWDSDYGAGLAWGTVYGLQWWLLGATTLFPVLLRQPVDWSLETVSGLYPSLIGHLLYGIGLGVFFQFLAHRYWKGLEGRSVHSIRRGSRQWDLGLPALWVVTLVLGVMLPLLLSMEI